MQALITRNLVDVQKYTLYKLTISIIQDTFIRLSLSSQLKIFNQNLQFQQKISYSNMLKKSEQTGHEQAVSKSETKNMRQSILNESKFSDEQVSVFWNKKSKVMSFKIKTGDDKKCEHVVVDNDHHFIWIEKKTIPSLKLIHMYPDMYPRFTVDPGAIKFVLKGANIMCPGLTNQFGSMQDVQQNAVVSIYVNGFEHAVGIGITTMSTEEIRKTNQGVAVELVHYVGDSFWTLLYGGKN